MSPVRVLSRGSGLAEHLRRLLACRADRVRWARLTLEATGHPRLDADRLAPSRASSIAVIVSGHRSVPKETIHAGG